MKRTLSVIIAASMILAVNSCQKEPVPYTRSGEVEFSISAGIPRGISTYAEGLDAFSHQGGATNLSKDEYVLRYTLQVFDNDGKLAYEGVQYAEDFGGVTFDTRLLAKEYDFVFWADFVSAADKESDLYYNTEDLRKITYTDNVTSDILPSDALDAYYKTEEVNLTQAAQNISNIVLKRPFGKIRFVATDELSEQQKGTVDGGTVAVKFNGGTVLPNEFDAQTGKSSVNAEAPARVSDYQSAPLAEKAYVNGNVYENAYLLGYDYIFYSENIPSYTMDVTVGGMAGVTDVTRSLSSIPVYENKLTTVVGNFYTNEGMVDVYVDDDFGGEEIVEPEDFLFPDEGVLNCTTNERYDDIATAIAEANSGDVLTLAASNYAEVVEISDESTNVKIVGQEGTVVDAVSASRGTAVFENISFTGSQSVNEKATVYAYGDAVVSLVNCDIDAPEDGQTRPIASVPGFSGTFSLEGCTIDAGGANYFYLNAASESGKIVLKDNTFTGKGGTIEIMNAPGDEKSYPVVEGNDFGWLNPSFTYWSNPVITDQSQLDPDTKQYVSEFLDNNTVPAGVKVAPYGGTSFIVTSLPLNVTNITTGKKYETIREAVINSEDGQTISLAEGNYDLGKPAQIDAAGPYGYYLKVDKSLSFVGDGAVVITTSEEAESNTGGVGSLQNLVTVDAENVSFENITFKANYNNYYGGPNKIIEVRNAGFRISNCEFIPNEKAPEDCGSAVYFSQNADAGVVENCVINYATVSFDGLMKGNFTVKGNKFVGGNDNFAITTPNWTSNDVTTSTLYVNLEGNSFEGFDEFTGANPAVRGYYGILNLKDNTFPTDGIYWKASQFGSIFVDYDSPVSQTWTKDRTEPKSFAISNDVIEFETMEAPASTWYAWHGRKAAVDMEPKSSWEVTSTLTLTGENRAVSKSIWLNIDVDWPVVLFKQDENGNRMWRYWDSTGEGAWVDVPADKNIPTVAGDYEIKIAFDNGTITHFINGTQVASYTLNETSTAVKEIIFNSYSIGESYMTKWTYPEVR